jgi:hypothetical protein
LIDKIHGGQIDCVVINIDEGFDMHREDTEDEDIECGKGSPDGLKDREAG